MVEGPGVGVTFQERRGDDGGSGGGERRGGTGVGIREARWVHRVEPLRRRCD